MLESLKGLEFEYQKLTSEEQEQRGILGRLKGVIADFKNPTRNGRFYSEEVWNKAFNDPIVQEQLNSRLILGELQHPVDRLEIDPEKIAICLAEQPKKGKDGKLYGIFDILNTPNGKILKTLCDYGSKIGVSSRADGETEKDFDGNESVKPDSFNLMCWDAVLLPAVKEARMEYVTESLDTKKTLKQALCESLETASAEDKKIMTETLKNLNIEYNPEKVIDNNMAANNAGANVIHDLQESLLSNQKLEAQITELQEKLSVCYAKEAKYEESIAKLKTAIRNLSESASSVRALQGKINTLTEELNNKDLALNAEKEKVQSVLKEQSFRTEQHSKLSEAISAKDLELNKANSKINSLNERLEIMKRESIAEKDLLTESLAEVKKNLAIKTTEYSTKLANSNKLVEQYRTTAKTAVNRYINSQAIMLGVSANEIKNKLPENYSFNDIDTVCESLRDFKLKVSKLPITLDNNTRVKITESKQTIVPSSLDDQIDESLIKLAKLN